MSWLTSTSFQLCVLDLFICIRWLTLSTVICLLLTRLSASTQLFASPVLVYRTCSNRDPSLRTAHYDIRTVAAGCVLPSITAF